MKPIERSLLGGLGLVVVLCMCCIGCSSSGEEGSATPRKVYDFDPRTGLSTAPNPTIASDVFLSVVLVKESEKLTCPETRIRRTTDKRQLRPNFSGDHALAVVDKDGRLQFITFFEMPDMAWGEGIDEETGKRGGQWMDVSKLPQILRVPINSDTREIYVLDRNKNRILDIPFDPSAVFEKDLSDYNILQPQKSLVVDNLFSSYPDIEFWVRDDSTGFRDELSNETYARALKEALDSIPADSVINSIVSIFVVEKPQVEWAKVAGMYVYPRILIRSDIVKGEGPLPLSRVLAHEAAHRYVDFLEERGIDIATQYEDIFEDMLDINSMMYPGWSDVTDQWYGIQEDYRGLRAANNCPEGEFVESQFEYGQTLTPSGLPKEPTIDEEFHNGFVSPYASTDVGEDIADTYEYALSFPKLYAQKVTPGNVYELKLFFLKNIGMLPEEEYNNIIATALDIAAHKTLMFGFRYKGIRYASLNFTLNGTEFGPSFSGSGEEIATIENGSSLIQRSNTLALSTVRRSSDGDADDIEVEKLQIEEPGPVDPDTGCDNSIVYLSAPEPVHLGNGNCSADVYCSTYSPLQGTSHTWVF